MKYLFLSVLLIASFHAKAVYSPLHHQNGVIIQQPIANDCDRIFLKNGRIISAEISSINKSSISYYRCKKNVRIIKSIKRSKVKKLLYANGVEDLLKKDKLDDLDKEEETYLEVENSRNMVFIGFLIGFGMGFLGYIILKIMIKDRNELRYYLKGWRRGFWILAASLVLRFVLAQL